MSTDLGVFAPHRVGRVDARGYAPVRMTTVCSENAAALYDRVAAGMRSKSLGKIEALAYQAVVRHGSKTR